MANKTIVQLTSKPTLTASDLVAVGDASTAILYKRTIADLFTVGGVVTSVGTTNFIPKFNSAGVLGNSSMQTDANGNIGLGVAPSAWGSSWRVFEQVGGSLWSFNFQNFSMTNNAIHDGTNYIYKNTSSATSLQQSNGVFYWYTAPSGTAGTAITFTQAMTLNASGRLLLGQTTDNGARLQVTGNATVSGNLGLGITNVTTGSRLEVAGNISIKAGADGYVQTTDANNIILRADQQAGTNGKGVYLQYYNAVAWQNALYILNNNTSTFSNLILQPNGGNVGIGIINPAYKLDVAGDININGVFRINGTPINSGGGGGGTITGSGTTNTVPIWTASSTLGNSPITVTSGNTNILVGTTGGNAFLTMTSIAPYGFSWGTIKSDNGAGAYKTIVYDASDHNWYVAGTGRMYLSSAGDLYINQSTTSGTYKLDVGGAIRSTVDLIITSDKRVKDNIINVTDALSKVDAMQGVYYTRKDITNSKQYIGFLAQDIEGALPQVVNKDSNGDYGVSYGNITALHNEAIKELNKEIKHLKSIINGSTN